MAQEDARSGRLSPRWWGFGGAGFGAAAFVALLWTADPKAALGDSLQNALTAFLGCVVAGWGITQAVTAQQARDAADRQARAAADQVEALREQIGLQRTDIADSKVEADRSRADAEAARDHADRTLRATIKQRLDARMPRVIANTEAAGSGRPLVEWRYRPSSVQDESSWTVSAPAEQPFNMHAPGAPSIDIRLSIGIHFVLLGSEPARIDCDCIEKFDMTGADWPLILTPDRPEARLTWSKVFSANALFVEAVNSQTTTSSLSWRPRFLVRDFGMNAGDEIGFSANLGPVKRDGEYLTLVPELVHFGETYAGQLPRRYEYFDRPEGMDELGIEMTPEQKRSWGIPIQE